MRGSQSRYLVDRMHITKSVLQFAGYPLFLGQRLWRLWRRAPARSAYIPGPNGYPGAVATAGDL